MRPPSDLSVAVLAVTALAAAVVAYLRDPGLPMLGARTGFQMLWFILPRLVPALLLAGLLQVLVPQQFVGRYFGREAGVKGIAIASLAAC
jgi:uncharacterized membrane protein YraQ (UPF0718 family)